MAANRAYAVYNNGSFAIGGGGPQFQVQYFILASDDSTVKPVTPLSIYFTYADNNMQQLIISAIQAHEGDDSLQVYLIP